MSKYNWEEIQKDYDNNLTYRKLQAKYGISQATLAKAKLNGLLKTRTNSESQKLHYLIYGTKKLSEETKLKISKHRKKYLEENPDKVPYRLNHSSKESYPEKYFRELFIKEKINLTAACPFGIYELDFADIKNKIDIEIDGSQHIHDPKIVQSDIRRTALLEKNGWKVFRIDWAKYKKMSYQDKENIIQQIKLLTSD